MSDPFLDDESGSESSQPREFYDITQSAVVNYRIASGPHDVVYGGNTYSALPIARTELGVEMLTGAISLVLVLPLSHGLPQRWMAQGSPPRQIAITAWRLQTVSGLVERIWSGYVTSMSIENHLAKFTIPSRLKRDLDRDEPSLVVDRQCGHILYDSGCRVDRNLFKVATTVASYDGRRIVVASVAPYVGDDTFFPGGELVHVATGERQTIFAQAGVTLDLQAPIPEIAIGDAVQIFAGCTHQIDICHNKFANEIHYGGFRWLPNANIFLPSGWGVVT